MKKILIVVDMQNGFTNSEQTNQLKSKIGTLLERRIFDVVVATRFLNSDKSVYEQLLSWNGLKTPEEQELVAKVKQYADHVEDKYVYTCVNANFIQKLCQMNDGRYPTQIYLAGVDTDCCVMTIATDLFENNIRPIVLTEYCGSNGGPESHQSGLHCMKRLIGLKQLKEGIIEGKKDIS